MLKFGNISLRPVEDLDLDVLFALESSFFLNTKSALFAADSFYKFKQRFYETAFWGEEAGLALILNAEGSIIGKLEYSQKSKESLDVSGIIYKKEDRNKGNMTLALKSFSAFLFQKYKINRLQILVPDYNRAAIAAVQKCGFVFEGIARQALYFGGRFVDLCQFALLREDCKNIEKLF